MRFILPKHYEFYINDTNIQSGGDGYTIDVNRSIGGLVGRSSRYSFNYAPIYYGDLIGNQTNLLIKEYVVEDQNSQKVEEVCGCGNSVVQKNK
jgi:hypothetical protein